MLKEDKKGPRLKAKAAETRHLVPFGVELGQEHHKQKYDLHSKTVYQMVSALMDFYMAIPADVFEPSHAADACN
eukprot:11974249-Alexandrium_andersonii.AAC.1